MERHAAELQRDSHGRDREEISTRGEMLPLNWQKLMGFAGGLSGLSRLLMKPGNSSLMRKFGLPMRLFTTQLLIRSINIPPCLSNCLVLLNLEIAP